MLKYTITLYIDQPCMKVYITHHAMHCVSLYDIIYQIIEK